MKTSTEVKLYQEMSVDEQLRYACQLTEFAAEKLPVLEKLGDAWELSNRKDMESGLKLLAAFQYARDFVDSALRYGDYSARVYRLRFYIEKMQKEIEKGLAEKGIDGKTYVEMAPRQNQVRRGRPVSAETMAKREAEAKAAARQTTLIPEAEDKKAVVQQPYIAPGGRTDVEYKLSIAQIRSFLPTDLQEQSDQIRALRTTFSAASERAKTMSDMKAAPATIKPWAQQASDAQEAVRNIYNAIDEALAIVWYRLQNDEPYRKQWLEKFGFKSLDDLHPDLLHDLKKHYQKVQSSEFDLRCKTLIEQENPEYIARQKEDSAKKKEAQEIVRYLKRKDQPANEQRVATSRKKYARLEELLGKKEAADYRPLLTKIEEDYKKVQNTQINQKSQKTKKNAKKK